MEQIISSIIVGLIVKSLSSTPALAKIYRYPIYAELQDTIQEALAKRYRYPTDAELQDTIEKFNQWLQKSKGSRNGANFGKDYRTESEKQELESFVEDWAKVNPELAVFLGKWLGYEEEMTIYPSKVKGRVCIVHTVYQSKQASIIFGKVTKGNVYTDTYVVVFRQKEYIGLGRTGAIKRQFFQQTTNIFPRPLPEINLLLQKNRVDNTTVSKILQKYEDAGCTSSLPE